MATAYRIELSAPRTTAAAAKVYEFTAETGNVLSVDCELKRDKKRLSILTVKLHTPQWWKSDSLFARLPDPAFATVPISFYLARPGSQVASYLAFAGKITSMEVGFPGPSTLTLVAHDHSVDLRRRKQWKAYKGLTSVQLAERIAKDYGFTVNLDALGSVTPSARTIEIGTARSDWDHLARALDGDGLHVYMVGSTIHVTQDASKAYPTTFVPGQPPVEHLNVTINHVGTPGGAGDMKTNVAMDSAGVLKARSSAEATAEKADSRTHRRPVGGTSTKTAGSHSEDVQGSAYANKVQQSRRRKDTASLVCSALPDIGLQHIAILQGWGAKVDSSTSAPWYIREIKHGIIGAAAATTTLSMARAPSPGSSAGSGIALEL